MPDTDLEEYRGRVADRFANPKIGDTIRRLCFDGSNRQPKFIIPSVADRLAAGGAVTGLALESALWRRYCLGATEAGEAIAANDPDWDRLQTVARASENDPGAWLGMEDIYGEVGRADPFRAAFARAHDALKAGGVASTPRAYLDGRL